ncbi:hypothetical protein KSP40_PGU017778 [Platanthera guangdongensis]|uniref:Guanylyl cyclase n=1 Tax=Platanthera guangdongensis TaxID=2320717 RepID=A0ABR2M072_9ASPA
MDGSISRCRRTKFLMHIFITLCFALCLIFDSEKLPLVDLKSRVSGIAETEDPNHAGGFSKLTAGLVMCPLCFIVNRLVNMVGDGKNGGQQCEADAARSTGFDACATIPARSHFVDVPHVRQQFHWDCGLACVLMVMRTLGIQHYDIHHLAKSLFYNKCLDG